MFTVSKTSQAKNAPKCFDGHKFKKKNIYAKMKFAQACLQQDTCLKTTIEALGSRYIRMPNTFKNSTHWFFDFCFLVFSIIYCFFIFSLNYLFVFSEEKM